MSDNFQEDDGSRGALRWVTKGNENERRNRIVNEILNIFSALGEYGKSRLFLELLWEYDKSETKKALSVKEQ